MKRDLAPILMITHDLGVSSEKFDKLAIAYSEVIGTGLISRLLSEPLHCS